MAWQGITQCPLLTLQHDAARQIPSESCGDKVHFREGPTSVERGSEEAVLSALLLLGTLGVGPTAKTRPNPWWLAAGPEAEQQRVVALQSPPAACPKKESVVGTRTVPSSQDQASCSLEMAPGSPILACSWPAGRSRVGGCPALPCPPSGPLATLVKGEDSRSRISVWTLSRASVTLESTPRNEQTRQWDLQEKDGHAEELLVTKYR